MKKSLVQIVAHNACAAFSLSEFKSERELARHAGVAPGSVSNLLHPERRAPTARGDASPRLDVLAKIAASMGYQPWELMVENFNPREPFDRPITKREAEVYRRIADAYRQLPIDPDNGK